MRDVLRPALVLALAISACDYDPHGRCETERDCASGETCASGVCTPAIVVGDQAPVAAADAYGMTAGTTLDVPAATGVLANDSDPDGDPLVAEKVDSPASGIAYLAPSGAFTYVPMRGFTGTDTFTYRASDGTLRSAVTMVTITVSP